MCPVKTETISFNVPRAEAAFWRKLAFEMGARSRGTLQKIALLAGLEKISPTRAAELREIRRQYYGAALALLMIGLTLHALLVHDEDTLRRGQSRARLTSRSACGRFETEGEI